MIRIFPELNDVTDVGLLPAIGIDDDPVPMIGRRADLARQIAVEPARNKEFPRTDQLRLIDDGPLGVQRLQR